MRAVNTTARPDWRAQTILLNGEYEMRTIDLSPLYRNLIGADRMASLLESLEQTDTAGYPPYDIEAVGDNQYRITLAIAGFSESEIEIQQENNRVIVSGVKAQASSDSKYLHQGIAKRNFERRFQLADHVRAVGASYNNGLLHIDLVREIPEEMKPRTIPIGTAALGNQSDD